MTNPSPGEAEAAGSCFKKLKGFWEMPTLQMLGVVGSVCNPSTGEAKVLVNQSV